VAQPEWRGLWPAPSAQRYVHRRGGVRAGSAEAARGVPCGGSWSLAPDAAVSLEWARAATAAAGTGGLHSTLVVAMWAMGMPGTVLSCSSTGAAPTVSNIEEKAPLRIEERAP
jgi:hypothetical protein